MGDKDKHSCYPTMELRDMIEYFYLSAKQRQEQSTKMIEREVTSARDDIEAIKKACSTVRKRSGNCDLSWLFPSIFSFPVKE